MKVKATLNNLRTSPRKVRLVADSVKGMDALAALAQLAQTVKKTSTPMEKLLKSAIANAENNFGIDKTNLYVSDVQVGEGSRLKRWLPRAHGRATLLLKRTSHIYLTLEEKVEGKNRKTVEQLEKERAQKAKAKAKALKELAKEMEQADEEGQKAETDKEPAVKQKGGRQEAAKKGGKDSGWVNKVFQRKSA